MDNEKERGKEGDEAELMIKEEEKNKDKIKNNFRVWDGMYLVVIV